MVTPFDYWGMGVFAYLLGSIPFGLLFGRLFKGVDVRQGGSGHSGALNTYRMAGLAPALLTLLGDMGKAWVALRIGQMLDPSGWGIAVAAALVVVGHCWPFTTEFRGGMGMACGIAILAYLAPLALILSLIAWGVWLAIFRHFPRSQAAVALSAPVILWALGSSPQMVAAGLGAGAVLLVRHLRDLNRRTLTLGLR